MRTAQPSPGLLGAWGGGRTAPGSLVPPWKERGHECMWRNEPDSPAS